MSTPIVNRVNIVKKITSKTVNDNKSPDVPTQETLLYTVAGIASATKSGETQYGPWRGLVGEFMAQRVDGVRFRAMVCILPEPLNSLIADRVESGNGNSVQFAVRVSIRPNERSSTGYEYIAENVIQSDQADPVAMLLDESTKNAPALPAASAPAAKSLPASNNAKRK